MGRCRVWERKLQPLGNLGLVLSTESRVGFGLGEGKEDMLGGFAAKSKQGPREAGTQHGCWDVFFQRSLFYNCESLLPTWGIFMTPCICLQSASGLLRNLKAERETLYRSQSSRLGAVSKRAGVASWSTNPSGQSTSSCWPESLGGFGTRST